MLVPLGCSDRRAQEMPSNVASGMLYDDEVTWGSDKGVVWRVQRSQSDEHPPEKPKVCHLALELVGVARLTANPR